MHIRSRQQRSPTRRLWSAPSSSGADATDTDTRQTQFEERERPRPEASGSAVSSSRLSSIDDNVLRLASPQRPRHDGRQHKQSPLRDSPQSNGADPGPLVWVRVTRSGKLAPREPGGGVESYWWPACISEGRLATGPLTVSLYGEISPAAPKSIRLEAPSPSHILPFKLPGQDIPRFSLFTFRCLESGIQQQPLSKRPKTVLDEAWHSAVDLAHEVDASLNDGLPSNLSSYRVDTVRIHKEKVGALTSDDSEAKLSTNSPKTSSERCSPSLCDPLLEIPGELVFSLDKRGRTDYWAARVEQYLPPKTPSLPPKYRVRFKDDTFRVVSRDMFYTSDEPEFYTCRLGRYMSDDEESEADTDGEYVQYETGADEPAILLPPPDPEDFCELPIREQFAYVKPIIRAILNETYLPARERHRAFVAGGLSRFRLQKAATGKGDLTVRDVSRLGRVLQNWVLGPMHLQKVSPPSSPPGYLESESGLSTQTDIQVEHLLLPDSLASSNSTPSSSQPSQASSLTDVRPSESLRQRGSPSYEALSESDKLQYCLLVLFHEATLQLLLWRSGERRSPDLLSQDDEERLRLMGLAKSEERAWVKEITRMREMKTRKNHPSSPRPRAAVNTSSSGRTLRPRNPRHASIR